MGERMGMRMGMRTGKDKRMGEGVDQSKDVAGSRQAVPLARRTQHSTHTSQQGQRS
jgi:hypothetical protein